MAFSKGSRFWPWFYDRLCAFEERRGLLERRRQLVGSLTGSVLEVGAGTGLNFPHYPAGTTVFAFEPDDLMLERALPRVAEAEAEIVVFRASASQLPVGEHRFDHVVMCMCLCSIKQAEAAIAEAHRVLKPSGELHFLEHIRDPSGGKRARMQDRVNPMWRKISGGCNCNRPTLDWIADAGFTVTGAEHYEQGPPHVRPHVIGRAALK